MSRIEEVKKERALLVGLCMVSEEDFTLSMQELWDLAEACDMDVVGHIDQKLKQADKATYIF